MMREKLKRISRGITTFGQLLGWQQLFEYLNEGIGQEIVDISRFKPKQSVLILAPHPDDDVFACGGTVALLNQHGHNVHVAYITDGRHGTPTGASDENLIATRQAEARKSIELLGGGELHFWSGADSHFSPSEKSVNELKTLIGLIRPSYIFTPWYGDNHPDHEQTCHLLYQVLGQAAPGEALEVWQYEIWAPLIPNRIVPISSVMTQKSDAITAHTSQLGSRNYKEGIIALNTYRGLTASTDGPAEAFFALPGKLFIDFYASWHDKLLRAKSKSSS